MASPLTENHRRAQLALRAQVIRDLQRLWPAMDWTDLDRTFDTWAVAVAALVDRHRTTSAGLAAAYLRAFRLAAGIPGAPTLVLPERIDPERLATALRVTTVAGTKTAAAHGTPPEAAMANAFVRSTGAITRLVLEAGRRTIAASSDADPRSAGWRRVTDASPCRFCADLASQVSTSHRFPGHDHCGCSAEPVFR